MTETRKDWPFGPALKAARERKGISAREAARRTNDVVSSGRWYQLESGWQKNKGILVPIGTTPPTVIAAARAVDWDQTEALRIAGFGDYEAGTDWEPSRSALADITDEELIDEVRRRMEARHDIAQEPAAATSTAQEDESKKARSRGSRSLDEPKDGAGGIAAKRAASRMRKAAQEQREVQ